MSEPSARTAAFSAVVATAIEEAAEDYRWSYNRGFDRRAVEERVEQDVSLRTIDRALADAAALGWVEDKVQGWDAGPLAGSFRPAYTGYVVELADDHGGYCVEVVEGVTYCGESFASGVDGQQREPYGAGENVDEDHPHSSLCFDCSSADMGAVREAARSL